ncbi:hypothetical protein AADZ84_13185 [Colwelliaceae bacterium MEBiC 14330]
MKYIILLLLMVYSSQGLANCIERGCSGIASELFDRYYLSPAGGGQLRLKLKVDSSKLDCSLAEGKYMTLMASHPLFEEIYSSLLTASVSKKKVFVRIDQGSDNCQVSYLMYYL